MTWLPNMTIFSWCCIHAFPLFCCYCTESIGGVVYSSNSDRAEKQRNGKADHLPTSQEELTATPSVYTGSESPGEKGLDQQPPLTTATPSPLVYISSPGEEGLDGQPWLTTQIPTDQPTTSGIDDTACLAELFHWTKLLPSLATFALPEILFLWNKFLE